MFPGIQASASFPMKPSFHLLAALLTLTLAITGCENYATVRETRPSYQAASPAGAMIVTALKKREKPPEVQMGRFIDAAFAATQALEKTPGDAQAVRDYNFAVSRFFDVLNKSDLQPWRHPVVCPGVNGNWSFSMTRDGKSEIDPKNSRLMSADRFFFRGTLVHERAIKPGLGAPMIIASKGFAAKKLDPFGQGEDVYYGTTQILRFNGRNVTAVAVDPLATEDVEFAGHTFPIGADFTASIGLALAELDPRRTEIKRMFNPEKYADTTRLARLQPYNPKKIPVLFIHGLGDSQATWAPMIISLRSDPVIRQNYQFWVFSYPTGYPYPLMAAVLRQKMDAVNAYYPDHKPIVVVGHSMGGMIARSLMTDSRKIIWDEFFETPPAETPLSPPAKKILQSSLIFKHRPEISRVIFLSASLRGAEMAASVAGRLGSTIISLPEPLSEVGKEVSNLTKRRADGEHVAKMPNSVDVLDPNNRFLTTINSIPLAKGIPYHSIIGDRGKGGNKDRTPPESNDGLVAYWSSHIDGAESELIVPSDHWSNQNPQGIAEVDRILRLHLQTAR